MSLAKNQAIQLKIESLSSDGNGIGRYEGQVIFVPGSAPEDVLEVKIVKTAKAYAFARIVQVITPSSKRQADECPISTVCGGCCFRHLTYLAELEEKQGFVADALERIGKIQAPILPIIPSPQDSRYRNKVQYPVALDYNGNFTYGFYANRSHRVVPCEDCLLQPTLLNKIAARTANLLAEAEAQPYDEKTGSGLIRHICLRKGFQSGEVLLCLVALSNGIPRQEYIINTLTNEFPEIRTIALNINHKNTNVIFGSKTITLWGTGFIQDTLSGVPLLLDPLSFSQVNSAGAEKLFAVVKEFAQPKTTDSILDLYCGSGVIGLSMAKECKELIGVEIAPSAIESAKKSAALMNLSNTRFFCEDASSAVQHLAKEGQKPTVVILDPPRKGADEKTLGAIVDMQPDRIVMVSCNPATLARDLLMLTGNGYRVQMVQPVDMFPRTKHVETVVLLVKTSTKEL